MLFNFRLTPIEEITPWGEPQSPNLHWFGLTLGEYWIDVGSDLLYESTEEFILEHGGTRFVDYQVARLHEDLLYLLPHALEPVPTHLEHYVWGAGLDRWTECWNGWNPQDADLSEQDADEIIDRVRWIRERDLDGGHLSAPPTIRFWTTSDGLVHIGWKAGHCKIDGVRVWSAGSGSISMPQAEFVAEVRAFHDCLFGAMAERIKAIEAGGLPARISISLEELNRNQSRLIRFEALQLSPALPTDWEAVTKAMQYIERAAKTFKGASVTARF